MIKLTKKNYKTSYSYIWKTKVLKSIISHKALQHRRGSWDNDKVANLGTRQTSQHFIWKLNLDSHQYQNLHIDIQETPIRPYAFVWQDLGLHHVWQNGDRDKENENEYGEEEGWEEKEKISILMLFG